MAFDGTGFLALWNDHAEAHGPHDVWHTREHVAERLGVPGFRCARRYAGGEGPLPGYFTLYGLDSVAALGTEPYLQLLANPSEWSARMRPGMRNFLRYGCTVLVSRGAGSGGLLASALLRDVADNDRVAAMLADAAAEPAFTALHLGRIERSVPDVSFAASVEEPDADSVLIVEGYGPQLFRPAVTALAERLGRQRFSSTPPDFTHYSFAFGLDAGERGAMLPPPAP